MGIKFCPNCGSEEIFMQAGGLTGGWTCKECGFSSSIFPEKEIETKPTKIKKVKK